jgi:protoporphyrinogen oxidase
MPPPTSPSVDVAVLGAGLAGLSAAIELQRRGREFRVFEKLDQVGGHAVTIEEDGFRFDRTGHLLHVRDPEIRAQVLEWIGPEHEVVQRRSVVWSHGVYTRYPFQANTFGLPPDVVYECVLGFVRAAQARTGAEPKNFEDFSLQHFGAGISKHFMLPYNSRLWGVSPREITSEWCSRFVPIPTLEDVLAGAVGLNQRELGYNTSFVYPRRGIGTLPEAMLSALTQARGSHAATAAVELSRAPRSIDFRKREIVFDDAIVPYGSLVSTIPLVTLVSLLKDVPKAVAEAAAKLRCTHLYYLDVALERPSGQPFHWAYVPEAKYPFYRVGCYSHFSSAMAPDGKANLYVELADRAEPNLDTLLPQVASGLLEMGVIESARDIRFARLRRIDFAYVIFDHDYFPALEVVRPFLAEHGIVSTGRYGGWNYSSMEDALSFGKNAVRSLTETVDA